MIRVRGGRCLGILLVGLGWSGSVDAEEASPDLARLWQPFLEQHCLECHDEDVQKGEVSLHDLDPGRLEGSEEAATWLRVVEVLRFGEMPPEEEPQPTPASANRVADWMTQVLSEAGHESDAEHKLRQPGYGNLVNHEKLFDGSVTGPASSPPRFWRLHPEAYDIILEGFGRELPKGGPLSRPFTVGPGKGTPSNYAAVLQADSATLGQLMLNCRQVAQLQTTGFTKLEKNNRTKEMEERHYVRRPESFEALIQHEGIPHDDLIEAAVVEEFRLVLSRDPEPEERKRYAALLKESLAIGGAEKGLHTLATAVLLRPEAIYRFEIGLGETDAQGRRMLSSFELAHAIAFALTDLPPGKLMLGPEKSRRLQPPSLLDLAEQGQLETRDDVRRIVEEMWENDLIEKPRRLRFFQEYFGYHTAGEIFKGDRAPREFNTRHLVRDADDLVLHAIRKDRDVLAHLLTTEEFFFEYKGSREEYDRRIKYITDRIKPNQGDRNYQHFIERTEKTGLTPIPQANPGWRKLVRYYNLHEDTWDYPIEQPFAMPEGQRAGILTHPAWLVAWSGNSGNDPIRRGKWIYENLLAGHIPEIPITVNAQVPEDPHKTLRERLEVTREAECWKCHRKMNPLGFPFESFDDFGQYRTEEGLGHTRALTRAKENSPVVTRGEVIDSGDPALDGEVTDVRELMDRLAGSDRVRQSFVRHAFRYWMGRNERLTDSPTLIEADQAYVDGGGSFKALVISLLTSDSFLLRKEDSPPENSP